MGWNAFSFVFVNSSQGFTDSSPYSVKQACLFEFYGGVRTLAERSDFGTGSQKIYFWKACEKLFRESYSRFFDIVPLDGGKGLWSLISDDDVITGSGPNQENFIDFRGFRTYWIQF